MPANFDPSRAVPVTKAFNPDNAVPLNLPHGIGSFNTTLDSGKRELMLLMGRDPDYEQSGVDAFDLRWNLSKADTPKERQSYLTSKLGRQGWTVDRFGNLAITPDGFEKMGMERPERPVVIDEPGLSMGDVADLRGIGPSVIGATLAGAATGGMGLLAAAGTVALGSVIGKSYDEAAEAVSGRNLQSGGEVAADIGAEAGAMAVGEVIFRGILAPLGRKILAPNQDSGFLWNGASLIKPGAEQLKKDALELGVVPKAENLVKRPIFSRIAGMIDTVLGDYNATRNAVALNRELSRLRRLYGSEVDKSLDLGQLIKSNIVSARKSFREASRAKFALVDQIAKENLIPTAAMKAEARKILESFPKDTKGNSVLVAPERIKDVSDILSLPDNISVEQLQAFRDVMFDRMEIGSLTPGVTTRDASLLLQAANTSLDDAIATMTSDTIQGVDKAILRRQALASLKDAREFYRDGISKFDIALIQRIARDPSKAGAIDPERVVDAMFRNGSVTSIRTVMAVVSKETGDRIKNAAMGDILDAAMKITPDPLLPPLPDGTALIKALNNQGRDSLEAMFGKVHTENLYRLGKVIQSTYRQAAQSGGLVGASIAVHPLANLGTLLKFRILAAVISSKTGLGWLVEGLSAPKTRAGVEAITRLNVMIRALSDRYTMGKKFDSPPEVAVPGGHSGIR